MEQENSRTKVLITGASRGIGYAMAALFAQKGYSVYANYHHHLAPLRLLAETAASDGHLVVPLYGDVSQAEDVTRLMEAAGDVDILINNAGIAQTKQFIDLTEEDWDTMMTVNLKSAFLCSHRVLPHMIRQKKGKIINISSIWGVTGGACEVHYSAAKAGLIGFTKALAKEMAPSGIQVNCIAPGVIETDMTATLCAADREVVLGETPLGVIGLPQDVAAAALFLAEDTFITGEVLNINGGFHM